MRRIALLGALALLFAAPAAAHAAAWGVSNTTDTPVGQACAGFTGCSLREAVTSTELNPGPDAILVGTGTYPLTNGELTVTQSLTVARVGAGGATISGAGASRIFNVTGSGTSFIFRFLTVTDGDVSGAGPSHGGAILGGSGTSIGIESSTISNSSVSAPTDALGGAIFSQGTVSIGTASGSTTGSSITGNSATATGSAAGGGGVAVEGASLAVGARTTISNNTASAGSSGALDEAIGGGAVANGGITMNGVTVSGNSASAANAAGGGVAVAGGGTATFLRSTFSGNTATTTADSGEGGGGGLVSLTTGSVGLQFSTVSGNTATTTSALGAQIAGGGIAAFSGTGTLDASNSTIASNAVSAPAGSFAAGAGVLSAGSTLTLGATILAENTGSASQCDGGMDLVSDGYNVLGPVGNCNYSAGTGDVTGVSDAMLKPLGDYSGLTETRMLRLGSPALDIIPAADSLCSNASVDQRGIARPQNGSCDSGSVEARPATLALSPDPRTFATVPLSQTSTATVGVSNAGDLDTSTAPNASVAAPFSYTSGCASPVGGGGSCLMTLTFAPSAGGSVSRTLQVTSGSLSDTSTLTGVGWAPTRAPAIKGSPSAGFKSGIFRGEWPGALTGITSQWIRCDADGTSDCTDIAGATSTAYRSSGDDSGHTLRVRVTGTGGGVTSDPVTTGASPVVTRIIPAPYKAPQIKRAASPVTGTKLGIYLGQWTGAPITNFDIQWQRCDHAGANCTDIAGATSGSHIPVAADVDHTLVVRIVATNSAGSSTPVFTAPSGVVSQSV